jgi:hypothetical protein
VAASHTGRIINRAMGYRRLLVASAVAFAVAVTISAKKKNPDESTQSLDLPKEPPMVSVGQTGRLTFHVSPLTSRGLLSQQTREALKATLKENSGAQVVHIRAFVAGSGDARRVSQIVSEVFSDKRLAIPSLSVVQVGGLPLENAQVELEVISSSKREVNPQGLMFIPGQTMTSPDGASATAPLLQKSLDAVTARLNGATPVAATCFVSQMANPTALLGVISSRFPGAAVSLVQSQRAPWQALASCEAVGRGGAGKLEKLAFSGTQISFGYEEKDAVRAFERLKHDLAEAAGPSAVIVAANVYALSPPAADIARKLCPATEALTVLPFDGVAAMDAGFAVDAVAAVSK